MLSSQLPCRPELLINPTWPRMARKGWACWQECGHRNDRGRVGTMDPCRAAFSFLIVVKSKHWDVRPRSCQAEDKLNASGFCPQDQIMLQQGLRGAALRKASWLSNFNCTCLWQYSTEGVFLSKRSKISLSCTPPPNHENPGSCPKTAICQDLKGLGNVLIHPSSFFIYRNSGSKTGGAWPIAHNWTVTKHKPLHKSPVSRISSVSSQLYHPDSHSLSTQEPSAQIHGTQSTTDQSCAWSRHH